MKTILLLIYAITSGDTTMSQPVQVQQASMQSCNAEAKRVTHVKGMMSVYAFCVEGWEAR